MAKERVKDLFRVEIGETNHMFVEAEDWTSALKIAKKIAPKIFTGGVSGIRIVGTYSNFKGVWI